MKARYVMMVVCWMWAVTATAQKIYSTAYENQAQIKVYVTDYSNQADLLVYKVPYENQARGNEGLWYFVKYENQADVKVYFVKYENQADLKVYFVKYENQAGWQNRNKIHLLYGDASLPAFHNRLFATNQEE